MLTLRGLVEGCDASRAQQLPPKPGLSPSRQRGRGVPLKGSTRVTIIIRVGVAGLGFSGLAFRGSINLLNPVFFFSG